MLVRAFRPGRGGLFLPVAVCQQCRLGIFTGSGSFTGSGTTAARREDERGASECDGCFVKVLRGWIRHEGLPSDVGLKDSLEQETNLELSTRKIVLSRI